MTSDPVTEFSFPSRARVPNMARIYSYLSGGKDHYDVDRRISQELETMAPGIRTAVRAQQQFQTAVVETVAQWGVRQFLVIGCGLPLGDTVHDRARRIAGDARTVYVDDDPLAYSHSRALLEVRDDTAGETAVVIQADLRQPDSVLAHPRLRHVLDLSQPVAALYVSVLHCIPDPDDPWHAVATMMTRLSPGSILAVSHLASDDPPVRHRVGTYLQRHTHGRWGWIRARQDVERFTAGLDLLPPGLGDVSAWPTDAPSGPASPTPGCFEYGGIARRT